MNGLKVILAVLAIFGTGIVSGTLIEQRAVVPAAIPPRLPKSPPMPPPTITMASVFWLDHHLKLSAEQKTKIADILSESRDRIKPYAEPLWAKLREESTTVSNLVKSILTEEQAKKFEKLPPRMRPDWDPGRSKSGRFSFDTNSSKVSGRPPNRFDPQNPLKEGSKDTNRLRRPVPDDRQDSRTNSGKVSPTDTQAPPIRP